MSIDLTSPVPPSAPRWQPLAAVERRILGVLIEKAKTTPENYPLSLNSLRTGCNQKSNRSPLMTLEEDQVAEALETLRKLGAVAEIQGGARVDKYRHLAYDWFGVDKVELAVMAELLLRGAQTVGELRGRAARMEPIKDLAQLQPVVDSLLGKGLIVRLTPAGRGSVVTHALYTEREMEKVRREASALPLDVTSAEPDEPSALPRSYPAPADAGVRSSATATAATDRIDVSDEIRALRDELSSLRRDLDAARAEIQSTSDELRRQLDDLNRQLGN
jgi:uncharacterized protein YceH (UPF0502 family)